MWVAQTLEMIQQVFNEIKSSTGLQEYLPYFEIG